MSPEFLVETKQVKNGAIQLSNKTNENTGLAPQMTNADLERIAGRLIETGDPAKIEAGNLIGQGINDGTLKKVVTGINRETGNLMIVPAH